MWHYFIACIHHMPTNQRKITLKVYFYQKWRLHEREYVRVNTVKLLQVSQFLNNKHNNILSSYTCKLMNICLFLYPYYRRVKQFYMFKICFMFILLYLMWCLELNISFKSFNKHRKTCIICTMYWDSISQYPNYTKITDIKQILFQER